MNCFCPGFVLYCCRAARKGDKNRKMLKGYCYEILVENPVGIRDFELVSDGWVSEGG